MRDLLLRAKHLFVAATRRRSSHRRAAGCADGATQPLTPWAARVTCAALEDIAGALVEGGVELPGTAGLVAARSIVRP